MALPKIDLPIFEGVLPSTGEKIKYRAFTVKEEKILLVAQEAEDSSQLIVAIKQVVNNCLIDKDVSELAMFDLEYVILAIRSKSVDNAIQFAIRDPETDEQIELEFDIEELKVETKEGHTNEVKISDEYTLFLKYPTIDQYIAISEMDPNDPLLNYVILISCLDKVASEDEVYEFKNYTQAEIDEFMEGVSANVVKGIEEFFSSMPKLRHEIKYKNKNGKEGVFVVQGLNTFFL
jgi:hypothetical protein